MSTSAKIDRQLGNWSRVYPELDVSALAVVQRCIWIGRLATKRLSAANRRHGLQNRSDYEALLAIFHARPESLSPAEIAGELESSTSGMTGRLDRLEALGLVARRPDPNDRRTLRIDLTDKGHETVVAIFRDGLQIQKDMLDTLDESQQVALRELLNAILVRINP